MALMLILTLICIFNSYLTMGDETVKTQFTSQVSKEQSTLETYIVLVNVPDIEEAFGREAVKAYYNSFLPAASRMDFTYHNVVNGFAARLSAEEVKAMEKMDGFVSAWPQKLFALHTTHSPSFLGLQQNLGVWLGANYGKEVIIGVLDSGITPDHPSFNDEGMSPPPAKWKGKCDFEGKACNKKLIGARSFVGDNMPPIDENGHGTHTSSTAAGNFVSGANVFGQANGTASGMAPFAHLAMYKVVGKSGRDESGRGESAILAAMDAAVEDGVDVLSLSLGVGKGSMPFYFDSVALGAFGATQKGIFVSCSAGNSGPKHEEQGYTIELDAAHDLPATYVSYAAGVKILEYMNSAATPMATLAFKGTVIGGKTAPMRYCRLAQERAPGLVAGGYKIRIHDHRRFAKPRPNLDQKPIVDERMFPANLFGTGSGHVNPSKATDPGLVYDIKPDDYIPYLCGLNYSDQQVRIITKSKVNCTEVGSIPEAALNYPSFAITLGYTDQTYTRTVRNVGPAGGFSYRCVIVQPLGVTVTVDPETLEFSEVNQELTYKVTFSRSTGPAPAYVSGFLRWASVNNKYVVKSPISVKMV
ncbi:hypothetical protein RHMOL_Rhmol07G0116200 [Rhododendron molle]|uniref:Uncharacterized protein n=1 Tax=Rhododendron molle TaxID=49168 RepID=A0ACC0N0M4_RHOML|nr:hypothetical protein RHMOL_Rhmol07G0116200 [Rhododendron molle]